MEELKLKELLEFLVNRKITNLYKQFFIIMEDLRINRKVNLSQEEYLHIRKKILDSGNDAIREINENLDKFEIKIKE